MDNVKVNKYFIRRIWNIEWYKIVVFCIASKKLKHKYANIANSMPKNVFVCFNIKCDFNVFKY